MKDKNHVSSSDPSAQKLPQMSSESPFDSGEVKVSQGAGKMLLRLLGLVGGSVLVGIFIIAVGYFLLNVELISDIVQTASGTTPTNEKEPEEYIPDFPLAEYETDQYKHTRPEREGENVATMPENQAIDAGNYRITKEEYRVASIDSTEMEWSDFVETDISLDLMNGSESLIKLPIAMAPHKRRSPPYPAWMKYAPRYRKSHLTAHDLSWKPQAAFSKDNKRLYLIDFSNTLHVYDLEVMHEIGTLDLPGDCTSMVHLEDSLLIADSLDQTLFLVDALTFDLRKSIQISGPVKHLVVTPGGERAFLEGENHFTVFDLETFRPVYSIDTDDEDTPEEIRFALSELTSMCISPKGDFLYTLNERIHKIRIDESDLIHQKSSPQIVASMLGFESPISVSEDGKWIGVVDLAHDPRVAPDAVSFADNEDTGLFFTVYRTDDLSERKNMTRNDRYPMGANRNQSPLLEARFTTKNGRNSIRLVSLGGLVSQNTWDKLYNRWRGKSLTRSHFSTKKILPVRKFVISPDEQMAVTCTKDHVFFRYWNSKDLTDLLSRRSEGTSYVSPIEKHHRVLDEMLEKDEGWVDLPHTKFACIFRGNMQHVTRFENVDVRGTTPSRDRSSIYFHDGEVTGIEFNMKPEVIDRFQLPKTFWTADHSFIYTGNFNRDPGDDLFYFSRWDGRKRVVGFSKNGKLAISTEHEQGKPILNALRGAGRPYVFDLEGDGLDEIGILFQYTERSGDKKYCKGRFVLLNHRGHVQPSAEIVFSLPDFKYGDTDGDGRPNLYIAEFGNSKGLRQRLDKLTEINAKGERIRELHPLETELYNFEMAYSPKRNKSVFVGASHSSTSVNPREIHLTIANEHGEPIMKTSYTGDAVRWISADSRSPYFCINGTEGHHRIHHVDHEEVVAEIFAYSSSGSADYLYDPEEDAHYLLFSTGGYADLYRMVPPDDPPPSRSEGDPLIIDVAEPTPMSEENSG